jgi:hypothetical protein
MTWAGALRSFLFAILVLSAAVFGGIVTVLLWG